MDRPTSHVVQEAWRPSGTIYPTLYKRAMGLTQFAYLHRDLRSISTDLYPEGAAPFMDPETAGFEAASYVCATGPRPTWLPETIQAAFYRG